MIKNLDCFDYKYQDSLPWFLHETFYNHVENKIIEQIEYAGFSNGIIHFKIILEDPSNLSSDQWYISFNLAKFVEWIGCHGNTFEFSQPEACLVLNGKQAELVIIRRHVTLEKYIDCLVYQEWETKLDEYLLNF